MTTVFSLAGLASAMGGFFLARFFAGEETGAKGKLGNLRVKVRDRVVHIHHWLCGSFLLMGLHHYFISHTSPYEAVCYGLLIGIVAQGLTYRDFYRFVYKDADSCGEVGERGDVLIDY